MPTIRAHGLSAWRGAERVFDAAFGARLNPLRHLGAIGFLAFWTLAASGIVLYAVLDTSVAGAYRSIAALEQAPLALGRLLRGLHRYAADVLVLALVLHTLREWLHRHERGFRRVTWLTGVPLVGFVFACGIGGFWLNWDALGQYSATATFEWLDALPMLATPLARNFLAGAVNDRLFSLLVFVHLGLPLLTLFALWFHVQRLTKPAVLPPRALLLGTLGALAVLALVQPVTSHAEAALAQVPEALRIDWIVLFVHPIADAAGAGALWAIVAVGFGALVALPFLPQPRRAAVAVVDAANCNGCRRCFADCPYGAITMVPHPNQRVGRALAVVDADLCAGCGICAGACPSSTPFRSAHDLVTGIDMPQRRVAGLRRTLRDALAASSVERPLVVWRCEHGARAAAAADVVADTLLCTAQLPPSFVEYALRDGAAGVVVAACAEGGCEFRCGERWALERFGGEREPHLRAHVDRQRVELVFAGRGDEAALQRGVARLRERVAALAPLPHPRSAARRGDAAPQPGGGDAAPQTGTGEAVLQTGAGDAVPLPAAGATASRTAAGAAARRTGAGDA